MASQGFLGAPCVVASTVWLFGDFGRYCHLATGRVGARNRARRVDEMGHFDAVLAGTPGHGRPSLE